MTSMGLPLQGVSEAGYGFPEASQGMAFVSPGGVHSGRAVLLPSPRTALARSQPSTSRPLGAVSEDSAGRRVIPGLWGGQS